MTIRYRKLDPLGDYSFGHAQRDFLIDSPQAVAQMVQTALKLWSGEWYLDTTLGVPYAEGVLGKHSQATADATLIGQVKRVQFVTGIANFTSVVDPDTRRYTVTNLTINTAFGSSAVQMQNSGNF